MTETNQTTSSPLATGLTNRIAELPEGDTGDLQLLILSLADIGVQTARIKAIATEMNARGMFGGPLVEMINDQPYFLDGTPVTLPATTPPAEPVGQYLNSAEAAKYMGLKVRNPSCTMHRLVKSRALPKRMKMNKLVFLRDELDAYMAEGSWTGRGRPKGSRNKPKDASRLYPIK